MVVTSFLHSVRCTIFVNLSTKTTVVVVSGGLVFCILASWNLFSYQKCYKFFYSLFSREAKEFYNVQFGQLGRELQSLEILISVERTLVLKEARSERVNGI